MSFYELTDDELDELRWHLFLINPHDLLIPADLARAIDDTKYPSDITNDMLEEVFGGISFVKEDFWCNLEERAQ